MQNVSAVSLFNNQRPEGTDGYNIIWMSTKLKKKLINDSK